MEVSEPREKNVSLPPQVLWPQVAQLSEDSRLVYILELTNAARILDPQAIYYLDVAQKKQLQVDDRIYNRSTIRRKSVENDRQCLLLFRLAIEYIWRSVQDLLIFQSVGERVRHQFGIGGENSEDVPRSFGQKLQYNAASRHDILWGRNTKTHSLGSVAHCLTDRL